MIITTVKYYDTDSKLVRQYILKSMTISCS
ncbi:MAG: DUF3124 domain-containing protein [Okeania sp. SIO2C2]|uniref:DUF3124 domain-containing protein n=1 Tax=Okeania hirsuta TaxID=1458930 RepID=A0A3N6NWW1_9CYAN|nr:DUF3124 domain-containing protein [Okeania sp. SIO2G5]NEP90065.1 DUF3124 domain-containing protein [Okeania sp. SIO2C2]NEP96084.1 DUF3124 domain-containing protein [Okeania sp. SIO2F5]NEQ89727.1 DUF3124 domain-containing protein [Okeania sp. SIO2G4]NES76224.1 DUF3124 domain-containing protein [Okeania sp. SIO1H4]NET19666.1 DUF3124 domain-containing protein [Okeania sp. SIO1H5]NET74657.1 DUF3124 domain-containing protein [Okeania sp. SIO1F9]NET93592.1 DUF3124 domain-containing protein [Oke